METTSILFITMPLAFILTLGVLQGRDFTLPVWCNQYIFRHAGLLIALSTLPSLFLVMRYYNFSENEKKIRIKQKDILTFNEEA
jgi:hypothetical protein